MSFSLKIKLLFAKLIAKTRVKIFGLRANCLLTRYPLVWRDPNLMDCLSLCLLREHGYQVAIMESSSALPPITSPHHILNNPTPQFHELLNNVILLAEKDLLEF